MNRPESLKMKQLMILNSWKIFKKKKNNRC